MTIVRDPAQVQAVFFSLSLAFVSKQAELEKLSEAIDDDWSALRFRRVAYIKPLKRDTRRALSTEGKRRTANA